MHRRLAVVCHLPCLASFSFLYCDFLAPWMNAGSSVFMLDVCSKAFSEFWRWAMAVSNVRASPTSNNLHCSAPRMTCARMLAVSHFAQQSAKNYRTSVRYPTDHRASRREPRLACGRGCQTSDATRDGSFRRWLSPSGIPLWRQGRLAGLP